MIGTVTRNRAHSVFARHLRTDGAENYYRRRKPGRVEDGLPDADREPKTVDSQMFPKRITLFYVPFKTFTFATSVAGHKDLGNFGRCCGLDCWKPDLQTSPQATFMDKAGSLMFCKRISLVQVTATYSRHQYSATTLHASLVWGVQSASLANSFPGPEILRTQRIPPGYP